MLVNPQSEELCHSCLTMSYFAQNRPESYMSNISIREVCPLKLVLARRPFGFSNYLESVNDVKLTRV